MAESLVEFLRARILEDEVHADAAIEYGIGAEGSLLGQTLHFVRWHPLRVLAEVEAKRRIIDRYEKAVADADAETDTESGWIKDGVVAALEGVVQDTAQVYADHEAFQPEWKLQNDEIAPTLGVRVGAKSVAAPRT